MVRGREKQLRKKTNGTKKMTKYSLKDRPPGKGNPNPASKSEVGQ